MGRRLRLTAMAGAFSIVAAGCDGTQPTGIEYGLRFSSHDVVCQPAGETDLTAALVNESVSNTTIDFANHECDIAIYFDADAPPDASVRNVTVVQETGANFTGTGLWNNGGDVTVTQSVFTSDVTGQYVPIRFDGGATGTISRNEIRGTHRVGILVRGEGTQVEVHANTVIGSGAKPSGWAENGLQIDQGATATVVNNTFEGHWWDGEGAIPWASTAVLLLSPNGSEVRNNIFVDNEVSFYVINSTSNVIVGNKTSSSIVSASTWGFRAWGVILFPGSDNRIGGNEFSADGGAIGIYISAGSGGNRITGNRFDGFEVAIADGGDDSVIRGKPVAVTSF